MHDAENVMITKDNDEKNEESVKGNNGMGFFADCEVCLGMLPTTKVWKRLPRRKLGLSVVVEQ